MDGTPDLSENITDEDRYFASELYRILEDADLLKNYSKKALERAKEMTPSKYIEELTDILK